MSVTFQDAGPPPASSAPDNGGAPVPTNPVNGADQGGQPNQGQPNQGDDSFISMEARNRANAQRADDMIRQMREAAERGVAPDAPNTPPNTPSPSTPNPPPTTPDSITASESDLRRRLDLAENEARTWKGRTEAERARAQAEIDALQRRVAEIEGARAKTGLDAVLSAEQDTPLTAEEVESYGEMLDAFWRHSQPRVRAMVAAAVEGVRAEIAAAVAPVSEQVGVAVKSAQDMAVERFYTALTSACPEWESLEHDQGFLTWLQQPDPLFGVVRKEALDKAVSAADAARVAVFFNTFLDQRGGAAPRNGVGGQRQTAGGAPANGGNAVPAPAPTGPDPRPTLADFAAPGTTRSPTATPTNEGASGKRWTGSEIRRFYSEVASLKWTARPDEKTRVERDIQRAVSLGQVDMSA